MLLSRAFCAVVTAGGTRAGRRSRREWGRAGRGGGDGGSGAGRWSCSILAFFAPGLHARRRGERATGRARSRGREAWASGSGKMPFAQTSQRLRAHCGAAAWTVLPIPRPYRYVCRAELRPVWRVWRKRYEDRALRADESTLRRSGPQLLRMRMHAYAYAYGCRRLVHILWDVPTRFKTYWNMLVLIIINDEQMFRFIYLVLPRPDLLGNKCYWSRKHICIGQNT